MPQAAGPPPLSTPLLACGQTDDFVGSMPTFVSALEAEAVDDGQQRPEEEEINFWQLLWLFTSAPRSNVVLLVAMSVLTLANVFVASSAFAPIIGAFYETLLMRDLPAFVANCKAATVLCISLSLLTSTAQFLSEVLAVRWRAQLTYFLHRRYLHPGHRAFCWLARADCDTRDNALSHKAFATPGTIPLCTSQGSVDRQPAPQLDNHDQLDNPDQRIAADAKLLCDTLADTVQKIISAPFMIGINAVLALRAAGWIAPVAISVYFLLALAINHMLATAVSARVTLHQRLEGDLRARHRWLCSRALDVGLSDGARAAEMMVEDGLEQALGMQLRVAIRRWALNIAADLQMRMASIINYCAVAVAVFAVANSGWVWGVSTGMQDLEGPQLTAAISRASFYALAICQGWSDLVGASVQFGDIRGYSCRVRQLLHRMRSLQPAAPAAPLHCPAGPNVSGSSRQADSSVNIAPAVGAELSDISSATRTHEQHQHGHTELKQHPGSAQQRNVLHTADIPLLAGASLRTAKSHGIVLRAAALSLGSALSLVGEGDAAGANTGEIDGGVEVDRAQRCIEFKDLCVSSPLGHLLLHKLSLRVSHGQALLITGPNGCGKSTLVSVMGGLYPYFTGMITLPASSRDLSILPQRAVLAPGSLADLVRYPQPASLHMPHACPSSTLRHDVLWQRSVAAGAAFPGVDLSGSVLTCVDEWRCLMSVDGCLRSALTCLCLCL